MGNLTIPADLRDGVEEVLQELGHTINLRVSSGGVLDVNNPGAGQSPQIDTLYPFEGFIYMYDDYYVDGTTVQRGDRLCLVDLKGLPEDLLPEVGNDIVDGTSVYNVVATNLPEASGIPVIAILQLRG